MSRGFCDADLASSLKCSCVSCRIKRNCFQGIVDSIRGDPKLAPQDGRRRLLSMRSCVIDILLIGEKCFSELDRRAIFTPLEASQNATGFGVGGGFRPPGMHSLGTNEPNVSEGGAEVYMQLLAIWFHAEPKGVLGMMNIYRDDDVTIP